MSEKFAKFRAKIAGGLLKAYVYMAFRPNIKYKDKSMKNYDKPVIFVGNHTSHNDGIMSSVIFSKYKAHILVAKDWYEKPKLNWFLKYQRCIPMDRYKLDTEWLKLARAAVKNGESVIIYPEGKTRKEEEPDEFKSGFVMLAMMTGVDIVPFASCGEYKKFFGKRQQVLVGKPMGLTAEGRIMSPKYLEAESERFRQQVIELMKEIKEK